MKMDEGCSELQPEIESLLEDDESTTSLSTVRRPVRRPVRAEDVFGETKGEANY